MYTTFVERVGTGAPGDNIISISFPYLRREDIHVTVDGEDRAEETLTWLNDGQILLPDAAASLAGKLLRAVRETPIDLPEATFAPGGLDHVDLNAVVLQSLYRDQEQGDAIDAANARSLDLDKRAVKAPPGEVVGLLPAAGDRAGKLLAFNAEGEATVVPSGTPGATVTRSQIIDSTAYGRALMAATDAMSLTASLPTIVGFDTLAGLAGAVVAGSVNRVIVFGRNAAGDGGFFTATRYGGAPGAHPGLFPSNGGAVTWELDMPADRTIDPTIFNFKAGATANVTALHACRDYLAFKGGGEVLLPGNLSSLWPINATIVWNKPFVSLRSPGLSTNHNGGGGQRWSAGLIWTGATGGTMLSVSPTSGPTSQVLAGVRIELYLNGNNIANIGADIRSCRVCDFDLFTTKFNLEAVSVGVVNELAPGEARDTQKCHFKLRFRQIYNADHLSGEGNGVGLNTWGDAGANVSYNTFDIEGIHTTNNGCVFGSFDCNDIVWFRLSRPVGTGVSCLMLAGASIYLVARSNVFSGKYYAQGGTLIQGTDAGAAIPYSNRATEVDWENSQPEPAYGLNVPPTAFEWRTERPSFRLGSAGCFPLPNGWVALWGGGNIGANAAGTINLALPDGLTLDGAPVWGIATLNGTATGATNSPRFNPLSATQVQIVNTDGAPQFCSFFCLAKTKWTP